MTTVEQYVEAKTDDKIIRRRILADLTRGGVIASDSVDNFKKHIDGLLAKMNFKRAPIEGRTPSPYEAKIGEHDKKVISGVDPLDGSKLEDIVMPGNRKVKYNPYSGVVWPLPVESSASPA
jgi:hypothetical protein